MERTINQKQQQLARLESELSATETQVIEGELTSLERRELLDETKALAQKQGQLETEIQALKIDVAVKNERLYQLRNDLAYASY